MDILILIVVNETKDLELCSPRLLIPLPSLVWTLKSVSSNDSWQMKIFCSWLSLSCFFCAYGDIVRLIATKILCLLQIIRSLSVYLTIMLSCMFPHLSNRNKFYEAGDIGLSKSCTVPNLKNEKVCFIIV